MASLATTASNYFIPQQLAVSTSSQLIEPAETLKEAAIGHHVDTATLFGQIVQRQVPVFSPEKIPKIGKLRDLGRGGSFTALAGTLLNDLETTTISYNDDGSPIRDPTAYKAGQLIVARHLNFDILHRDGADRRSLFAPISTEILILSDERVRVNNQIAQLIGVGWESSPYDDSEVPRHWPFVLTAFGSSGTLHDFLRDLHRREAPHGTMALYRPSQMLLQKPTEVDWDHHLDWGTKFGLVAQIAAGLAFLHSIGVVHGDVKFENIVFGPSARSKRPANEVEDRHHISGTAQLCDFGSSFLTAHADTEDSLCQLRSYSFPWEAPEALSRMPAKDLFRTDVYSFGLVFARIMLDGNDPFDPSYHIASGRRATYDRSTILQLKAQDKLADSIMDRIRASKQHVTQVLLEFIDTIIRQTVRTDPGKRWLNMQWLAYSLQCIIESGGTTFHMADMSNPAGPGIEHTDTLADKDKFVQMNYEDSRWMPSSKIPDLQNASFLPHLSSRHLMREVFLDLSTLSVSLSEVHSKRLTSSIDAAAAAFQRSLCHIHGWGTLRSPEAGIQWLEIAASAGCEAAQRLLIPISEALGLQVDVGIRNLTIQTLKEKYKVSNDRLIAKVLAENDPAAYAIMLEENRTTCIDGPYRNSRYTYQQLLQAPVNLRPLTDLELSCRRSGVNQDLGSGMTYLHCASAAGDFEAVQLLTEKLRGDFNATNKHGRTALTLASCNGHAAVVEQLLLCGADPNIKDVYGLAPVHFLSRFSPNTVQKISKLLVEKGASIGMLNVQGENPLVTAMQTEGNFDLGGEVDALKAMLELGADPFPFKDLANFASSGVVPLAAAFLFGDADAILTILHFLTDRFKKMKSTGSLDHIAQPVTRPEIPSGNYLSEFCAASFIEILLQHHIPIRRLTCSAFYGSARWHEMIAAVLCQDSHQAIAAMTNKTLFQLAYESRAFDLVEILINDPMIHDKREINLSLMLDSAFRAEDIWMIKHLSSLGLKLEFAQTQTKRNMLHLAVMYRWTVKDVQVLFHGEEQLACRLVNELDYIFESPFDLAVQSDHLHMAEYFRTLGAEYDSEHLQLSQHDISLHFTLLGKCILFGDDGPSKLRKIRHLLQLNPSFVVCSKVERTTLHCVWRMWADQRKKYFNPEVEDPFSNDVLQMLLDHFGSPEHVNAQDSLGVTALHLAARTGNLRGIETLLRYGADINAIDGGGSTPLDTVGDYHYILFEKAKSRWADRDTPEGPVSLVGADIEVFLYAEVRGLLINHGAKSGHDLNPEDIKTQLFKGEIPEERLQKIREAEKWHTERLEKVLKSEEKPFIKPGMDESVFAIAPENRKDLGSIWMTLHDNENMPLIFKYDQAHGKGKQPEM